MLKGEAYFSVVHTKKHQKFRVIIGNEFKVEVLGTKFTVTKRPHKTRVVLNEGKVKVDLFESTPGKSAVKTVASGVMKPSEVIEVAGSGKTLRKQQVEDPNAFSAFLNNRIVLNNTPLSEVARLLEDTYGYKVTFVQSFISQMRFTGSSPSNRIDLLLISIQKSFDIKVKTKGKKVIIG